MMPRISPSAGCSVCDVGPPPNITSMAAAALRAVAARSYPPVGEHRDPAAAAVLGGEVLDPAREHAEPLVGDGAPAQGVVGVGVVPGAHDDEIGFEPSAGSGARQASIALAGKQNQ